MEVTNDNRPAAEASRLLPRLGRVGPDGRLSLATEQAPDGDGPADLGFPNDPRRA